MGCYPIALYERFVMIATCWDWNLLRAKFIRETEEDLAIGMCLGTREWWNLASAGFCVGFENCVEECGPCLSVDRGRRLHGQEVGARAATGD